METRSGVFSVGSKEVNKAIECDFGLGLRMQAKESSSSSSSFSAGFDGGCHGGAGGGPSLFCNRSNTVACFGDIYDVVGAGAASKSLHPFNLSGEMAQSVNLRVPFTASQWQELERQTIIYKYLMASVPVPPELLIPISRTQSNTSPSQSHVVKGSLELGISSCNTDPEPWRCKRTDGKKWRCSRDVAPDQKYCERHSHKSRPRSRKPVDLHNDSMVTNLNQKSQFPTQPNSNFSIFSCSMAAAPTSYDQPRNLEWFLKGETMPVTRNSNQEWHNLKGESGKCYREEQLINSNSYRLNENCSLLLNPNSISLNHGGGGSQRQAQEARHFLDVWSSARNECCSVPSTEKLLPPSSLTLSMCGGSEEIENGESGLRPSQWMSHGSWMGSPPGGPLAEALCLGISTTSKTDSYLNSSTFGFDNKG